MLLIENKDTVSENEENRSIKTPSDTIAPSDENNSETENEDEISWDGFDEWEKNTTVTDSIDTDTDNIISEDIDSETESSIVISDDEMAEVTDEIDADENVALSDSIQNNTDEAKESGISLDTLEDVNPVGEYSSRIEFLRAKANALPKAPGVYIMRNSQGTVIYVGKSRSLRNRVSQYFHGSHDVKTSKMASNVYDFRYVNCDTEMEALALENQLIKQYSPRYNIKLKDSKSYPYIKITSKDRYPKISVTRTRIPDGNMYFGPYSSIQTGYTIVNSLERTLGIPSCRRVFPDCIGKERPCMFYQIGRCCGLCTGNVSDEEYRGIIQRAAEILRGGTRETIADLTDKMMRASDELEFEEAAKYRDTIMALRKLSEKQKAVGSPDVECDVIGLHVNTYEGDVKFRDCASVFYIRSGYISDTEHFVFGSEEIMDIDDETSDDNPMSSFISGLYRTREYIPKEILLSFELSDSELELLTEYITKRAGHKVVIRTPKKGAGKYLCGMAVSDAREHSQNIKKREDSAERTLVNLASLLKLEVVPERIEAYDISNLGSEHITAGMITIVDGKFKKSDYRSFNIKTTETPDDYQSMREVISRRLAHITDKPDSDKNDAMAIMPDLILLDGGKGHVGVVRELMRELNYPIAVFGMVKDEHHKTRTITTDTDEVNIARHEDVFRFVYGIQEEVHRFTVSKMMNAKRKDLKTSSLEEIKGIGPKKAKLLLTRFSSLKALKSASYEELIAINGISEADANNIIAYFAKENKE